MVEDVVSETILDVNLLAVGLMVECLTIVHVQMTLRLKIFIKEDVDEDWVADGMQQAHLACVA